MSVESELLALRQAVAEANWALPRAGLVTMHSGNASGYSPEHDVLFIKPSGMDYEAITPENLVAVRVSTGEILPTPQPPPLEDDSPSRRGGVSPPPGPLPSKTIALRGEGESLRPSVDLPHHLFLYRNIPGIRGVIHTHSNYATAFAAVGRSIPLVLTAIADEFGAEIPCAPYVDNEGEHIGEAILQYRNRAPAILLGNHGVFAWGSSPKAALKAAVMTEDVAKTVWLAMQIGSPLPIPAEEAEKWYDRYHNRYGQ